ncbi:hypothetical protein ElyMa_007034300 [Elysia marginata]|uniref:Uncharacterized protein n=1 Tax=Elysia marginata TaxID=1093978 RepID=A0AAV4JSN9_9GAST|nr:hypothetical protein ElyMa_007034300 [Elysia marginata]
MREDLECWRDHADKFPVLLSTRPPPVSVNINTGASKSGWGGVNDGVTTGATAIRHRYAALQTTLYKSSINEPRSFAPSTHRLYSKVSRVEIYLHLRPILQTPIAVRGRKQVSGAVQNAASAL